MAALIPFVPEDNDVARGVTHCTPSAQASVSHNAHTLAHMLTRARTAGFTADDRKKVTDFLVTYLRHRHRPFEAGEEAIPTESSSLDALDSACLDAVDALTHTHTPAPTRAPPAGGAAPDDSSLHVGILADVCAVFAHSNPARVQSIVDRALAAGGKGALSALDSALSHTSAILRTDLPKAVAEATPETAVDVAHFLCDVMFTLAAFASSSPTVCRVVAGTSTSVGSGSAGHVDDPMQLHDGLLAAVVTAYERGLAAIAKLLAPSLADSEDAPARRAWVLLRVAGVSCLSFVSAVVEHAFIQEIVPHKGKSESADDVVEALLAFLAGLAAIEPQDVFAAPSKAPAGMAGGFFADLGAALDLRARVFKALRKPGESAYLLDDARMQYLRELFDSTASAVDRNGRANGGETATSSKADPAAARTAVKMIFPDLPDAAIDTALELARGDPNAAIDRLLTAGGGGTEASGSGTGDVADGFVPGSAGAAASSVGGTAATAGSLKDLTMRLVEQQAAEDALRRERLAQGRRGYVRDEDGLMAEIDDALEYADEYDDGYDDYEHLNVRDAGILDEEEPEARLVVTCAPELDGDGGRGGGRGRGRGSVGVSLSHRGGRPASAAAAATRGGATASRPGTAAERPRAARGADDAMDGARHADSHDTPSRGRGRGRGRGGRGGAHPPHDGSAAAAGAAAAREPAPAADGGREVTGHGPRARGGLTERDAEWRREHKSRVGNHNRKRGADRKLARGMM